jgi:hypothetical protein
MTPEAPGLSGQQVVIRPDPGFRRAFVRRGTLALVFADAAAAAGTALGTPMFILAGLCGLAAAGSAAAYVWQGRFATVLTPQGIRIRGYFNHFVPWSRVAGFAVHGRGSAPSGPQGEESIQVLRASIRGGVATGTRRPPSVLVRVHVVRTKGHKLRLRDPEFDDKVDLMRQFRQQYGPPAVTGPR